MSLVNTGKIFSMASSAYYLPDYSVIIALAAEAPIVAVRVSD